MVPNDSLLVVDYVPLIDSNTLNITVYPQSATQNLRWGTNRPTLLCRLGLLLYSGKKLTSRR